MKFYCRMDAAGSLQECYSQCADCALAKSEAAPQAKFSMQPDGRDVPIRGEGPAVAATPRSDEVFGPELPGWKQETAETLCRQLERELTQLSGAYESSHRSRMHAERVVERLERELAVACSACAEAFLWVTNQPTLDKLREVVLAANLTEEKDCVRKD